MCKEKKMTEEEAHERFKKYLESDSLPYGLTAEKIANRAFWCSEDGNISFSMERHQSLFPHVTGQPMSAFVETNTTYTYDPENDTLLEEPGKQRVVLGDIYHAVRFYCWYDGFDVEHCSDGKYLIVGDSSKVECKVSTYQEACEFVRKEVEDWPLDGCLSAIRDNVAQEQFYEIEKEFREACVVEVLSKLENRWCFMEKSEEARARPMQPFVGRSYKKAGLRGQKLLIMGESVYHPNPPDDKSKYNKSVIADVIGRQKGSGYWNKSRFYTRIARLFGYNAADFTQRKEFWHSVAYFNYLHTLSVKPGRVPPASLWGPAETHYAESLKKLKPDYVVTFGKRLWQHIPKEAEEPVENEEGVWIMRAVCPKTGTKLVGFPNPAGPTFRWRDAKAVLERQLP